MAPTRPEPEADRLDPQPLSPQPPLPSPGAAVARRAAPPPRSTPVAGAAAVAGSIELLLAQCRRRRGALSLLCIGVDLLEPPAEGLAPGLEQEVREELSRRMGHAVRGTDAILRESERDAWVVLPGGGAVAARVAGRLARVLGAELRVAGAIVRVAVRIGAASQPDHGDRAPALMQRATDCR